MIDQLARAERDLFDRFSSTASLNDFDNVELTETGHDYSKHKIKNRRGYTVIQNNFQLNYQKPLSLNFIKDTLKKKASRSDSA